jgi:hypothetical protein
MKDYKLDLFGGLAGPWNLSQWVTVDDRIRGGSSQSQFIPAPGDSVIFTGYLDT